MARNQLTLLLTLLDDVYYLPEWAECARRLWPEQLLVVDGGSRDGGPEFLASRTLPNLQIVHHPMEKVRWHYSAQLNYALRLVRNDWVLLLDADEVLWPPDRRLLDHAISRRGRRAVSLWLARLHLWPGDRTRLNWGENLDPQPRLWKRQAGIRWVNKVHNLQQLDGEILWWTAPRAELLEMPVILHRKLTAPYELRLARHRRWRKHWARASARAGIPIPKEMPDDYGPTLPLPRDMTDWRGKLMGKTPAPGQRTRL